MSKEYSDSDKNLTLRALSGDLSVRSTFKATYGELYQ